VPTEARRSATAERALCPVWRRGCQVLIDGPLRAVRWRRRSRWLRSGRDRHKVFISALPPSITSKMRDTGFFRALSAAIQIDASSFARRCATPQRPTGRCRKEGSRRERDRGKIWADTNRSLKGSDVLLLPGSAEGTTSWRVDGLRPTPFLVERFYCANSAPLARAGAIDALDAIVITHEQAIRRRRRRLRDGAASGLRHRGHCARIGSPERGCDWSPTKLAIPLASVALECDLMRYRRRGRSRQFDFRTVGKARSLEIRRDDAVAGVMLACFLSLRGNTTRDPPHRTFRISQDPIAYHACDAHGAVLARSIDARCSLIAPLSPATGRLAFRTGPG